MTHTHTHTHSGGGGWGIPCGEGGWGIPCGEGGWGLPCGRGGWGLPCGGGGWGIPCGGGGWGLPMVWGVLFISGGGHYGRHDNGSNILERECYRCHHFCRSVTTGVYCSGIPHLTSPQCVRCASVCCVGRPTDSTGWWWLLSLVHWGTLPLQSPVVLSSSGRGGVSRLVCDDHFEWSCCVTMLLVRNTFNQSDSCTVSKDVEWVAPITVATSKHK